MTGSSRSNPVDSWICSTRWQTFDESWTTNYRIETDDDDDDVDRRRRRRQCADIRDVVLRRIMLQFIRQPDMPLFDIICSCFNRQPSLVEQQEDSFDVCSIRSCPSPVAELAAENELLLVVLRESQGPRPPLAPDSPLIPARRVKSNAKLCLARISEVSQCLSTVEPLVDSALVYATQMRRSWYNTVAVHPLRHSYPIGRLSAAGSSRPSLNKSTSLSQILDGDSSAAAAAVTGLRKPLAFALVRTEPQLPLASACKAETIFWSDTQIWPTEPHFPSQETIAEVVGRAQTNPTVSTLQFHDLIQFFCSVVAVDLIC